MNPQRQLKHLQRKHIIKQRQEEKKKKNAMANLERMKHDEHFKVTLRRQIEELRTQNTEKEQLVVNKFLEREWVNCV